MWPLLREPGGPSRGDPPPGGTRAEGRWNVRVPGARPHLLSGGQKQRIAIANRHRHAAPVHRSDEPTAMLDPIGRADVLRTIKGAQPPAGVTVVPSPTTWTRLLRPTVRWS